MDTWANVNSAVKNMDVPISILCADFDSLGFVCSSGVAGSQGSPSFSLLRKLH
jgi:hypothetical protein